MNGQPNGGKWDAMVRNDGARAVLDKFGIEALPELFGKAAAHLSTDGSFKGSVEEGKGECRQVLMRSEHDGYEIRLLVYVEAKEAE